MITTQIASTDATKRMSAGERRVQILQAMALMLENNERITTAALAKKINVSEGALYRHFPTKAHMLEGLIDAILEAQSALWIQIQASGVTPATQVAHMVVMWLRFAQSNKGMVQVMVGDALVNEHIRLQSSINSMWSGMELQFKQALHQEASQQGSATPTVDAKIKANLLVSFVQGRLQRFSRSGFQQSPVQDVEQCLLLML